MPTAYFDRLRQSARAHGSVLCVGLDPQPELIPGGAGGALEKCLAVVRATAGLACAYKPNLAYWEQYGAPGYAALQDLRAEIPADVPVILDAKRGDIPETMRAYARALFDVLAADAITAHAYPGGDALAVLAEHADRGAYVVCRTSNPGAPDLQGLTVGQEPLYLAVGRLVQNHNSARNLGLVVGATAPAEIARVRAVFPELPFLVPGVGAQGGDLEAAVAAAWNGDPASCLVAVSRSVLYAQDAAAAAWALNDRIRNVVLARP